MSRQAISNYYAAKNNIKKQHTHYKVIPTIVKSHAKAEIKIVPLYDRCRFADGEYKILLTPVAQIYQGAEIIAYTTAKDGVLAFEAEIGAEQEYNVYVKIKDGENYRDVENFLIYALDEDMYSLRPYKADMHIHSYMSDGSEDPVYVAASYRKMGFDIMGLTDHHRYEPSRIAIGAYKDVKYDLSLCNGEEVHAPDNPVHIVNFGGSISVNEYIESNKDDYMRQVREIMATVTDYPDPKAENEIYMYASSKWVFNKIREGGGIAIFCHPFWRIGEGYHISERLTDYMFDKADFDAYEVVGGYYPDQIDSNAIQIAKYHDRRAKGDKIPIVGVSDSHGCDTGELMNWYSTIVFAKSPKIADVRAAVLDRKSVAVETVAGEAPRVYGEFRYVKFGYFVLREIFPIHDLMCAAEGVLMYEYSITKDESVKTALEKLSGRTAAYLEERWGNE